MKTLLVPWFIISCLLWLFVFVTRHAGTPIPYINSYLTDFLAVPVVANLGLWFQRRFIFHTSYYVLSFRHVIFIVLMFIIWFEILLPKYSKAYTADLFDVLMYIAGGLIFYKALNQPLNEEVHNN